MGLGFVSLIAAKNPSKKKKDCLSNSPGIYTVTNEEVRLMNKLIRMAIKWGPVVYPVVKKMMDNRKSNKLKTTYSK